MLYAKSTNGFYTQEINGATIPDDVVEITAEEHAALLEAQSIGKRIVPDASGRPVLQDIEARVPDRVTMRQARLALLRAGRLDAVTATIAALQSPQREAAQIEWEFAADVERASPVVAMIAANLPLSAAELDALFKDASAL